MTDLPPILTHPHPDEAHEALRRGVVQAVEQLDGQLQRINDALLLLQTTVEFAQGVLNTTRAARVQMETALGAIAILNARVGALEAAAVPVEEPTPTDPPEEASA